MAHSQSLRRLSLTRVRLANHLASTAAGFLSRLKNADPSHEQPAGAM